MVCCRIARFVLSSFSSLAKLLLWVKGRQHLSFYLLTGFVKRCSHISLYCLQAFPNVKEKAALFIQKAEEQTPQTPRRTLAAARASSDYLEPHAATSSPSKERPKTGKPNVAEMQTTMMEQRLRRDTVSQRRQLIYFCGMTAKLFGLRVCM